MKNKRLLIFSYNYPPDQSAGAIRVRSLVNALSSTTACPNITIFCSRPIRFGFTHHYEDHTNKSITVRRFWVPYLGLGSFAAAFSYFFFFIQVIPASLFVRPNLIWVTSAKLLTSFVASLCSILNRCNLMIDIRDTFSDNFFYFYRWKLRIVFHGLILLIENFVVRKATAINIVSRGFEEAYLGWESILKKKKISLTHYSNGIESDIRCKIQNLQSKSKIKSKNYTISYLGNLGEGQNILGLVQDLYQNYHLCNELYSENIKFNIYGSGSQFDIIYNLLNSNKHQKFNNILSYIVELKGFIPHNDIYDVYNNSDCLFLQLSNIKSLSMVIPTKVFEYAATSLPIIYSASGFSRSFISKIDGTIYFKRSNSKSLLRAINISKEINIDDLSRSKFLKEFDSDHIYRKYAHEIISSLHI